MCLKKENSTLAILTDSIDSDTSIFQWLKKSSHPNASKFPKQKTSKVLQKLLSAIFFISNIHDYIWKNGPSKSTSPPSNRSCEARSSRDLRRWSRRFRENFDTKLPVVPIFPPKKKQQKRCRKSFWTSNLDQNIPTTILLFEKHMFFFRDVLFGQWFLNKICFSIRKHSCWNVYSLFT